MPATQLVQWQAFYQLEAEELDEKLAAQRAEIEARTGQQ